MSTKMIHVKLKQTMAGPHGVGQAGKIIEVEEPTGRAWVTEGYAELVEVTEPAPVETASHMGAPETAEDRRRSLRAPATLEAAAPTPPLSTAGHGQGVPGASQGDHQARMEQAGTLRVVDPDAPKSKAPKSDAELHQHEMVTDKGSIKVPDKE